MGVLAQMGLPFGSQDHVPAYLHWRGATGDQQGCSGVKMVRGMSLPTGRGTQRMRNWGRAQKWDSLGGLLRRRGGGRNVASLISVLLSEENTGYDAVMMI